MDRKRNDRTPPPLARVMGVGRQQQCRKPVRKTKNGMDMEELEKMSMTGRNREIMCVVVSGGSLLTCLALSICTYISSDIRWCNSG